MENNVDIKKFILNWCDGQKITFVSKYSNVGDAFITLATIQILKSLGIDYTMSEVGRIQIANQTSHIWRWW